MNKEEKLLRENIQTVIKFVKQKRLNEENELRKIIRSMLDYELLNEAGVADTDPTPNKSTGINVLEDLLKKIIPVLEVDYKILTTSEKQRMSFRSHVINAIVNTLKPVEVNNEADPEAINEEISIDITDGEEDVSDDADKFIDIRSDKEKQADEEPADPREEFGIEGEDETGRNMAYSSFKKIESNIIDSYELLGDPEDKELFHDYLIANVKLYFDKFEDELAGSVEEPTNQAYQTASEEGAAESGGEVDLDQPTDDELDLGL